jgi:hypothetical protein
VLFIGFEPAHAGPGQSVLEALVGDAALAGDVSLRDPACAEQVDGDVVEVEQKKFLLEGVLGLRAGVPKKFGALVNHSALDEGDGLFLRPLRDIAGLYVYGCQAVQVPSP